MSRLGFAPGIDAVVANTTLVAANTAQSVSNNGIDIYNDTDTHTGVWKSLVILEETVINAITDNGATPSTIPTAVALPAGTFISANGNFTSIDLTSGMVAMGRI